MESQKIEYKQTWKDEYFKWICGFANAQGGTLYIGVDDNGAVCGVKNAEYLLQNLPNKCVQATGIVPSIELLSERDKHFLAIHINPSEQPIACNGKYYMRSGSTLQELSGMSLTVFLLKKANISWDKHTEPEATMEDINRDAIRYFIDAAVRAKRLDNKAKDEDVGVILKKLGLVNKKDELTFAALVLFGKDVEYYCPTVSFRIGRFGASQADLIIDDNIACPLIYMPDRIIKTLRTRYLISPISYEGLHRIESLEIPEDALREIICNAIVHRDYRGSFTQMRVWNDRMEIWNSGVFPPEITEENLMTIHESHPRNSLIAKVFYMAGFIENWGRGYEKIRDDFSKEHLQIPTFTQIRGGVLATIQRERFMAITYPENNDKKDKSSNKGAQKGVQKGAQKSAQKIIELITKYPNITLSEIADILGMTTSGINKNIKKLKEQGKIRRVGPDRGGHWEVV
ncbi:MAG: putative DNA binding domain-containing protein [Bacteroidales bacterium]|nr:putative DNA binding domain-containing protein [Bacteroidales bacterium]